MDPVQLTSLIQGSNILTSAERQYWLASLPRMTPEQQQKFDVMETAFEKKAKRFRKQWDDGSRG